MVDLFVEIDFSKELQNNQERDFEKYLRQAAKEIAEDQSIESIKRPVLDKSCQNFIIVTGLPITDFAKLDKLGTAFLDVVIVKFLKMSDKFKKIEMGKGPEQSNGCVVVQFNNPEEAEKAQNLIHGLKFFKDILYAFSLEEYEYYANYPASLDPPKFKSRKQLNTWLSDSMRRDQILLRSNDTGNLSWFFHIQKNPITETEGIKFDPDTRLQFSRTGAYLVSIGKTGFKLYGGSKMEFLTSFDHPEVKQIEFSPNDKYLVSFNGTSIEAPDQQNYIVWNVDTRVRIQVFSANQEDTWGTFKWSSDSKFLAKTGRGVVSVYDMPLGGLNQEQSLIIPGVQKCIWVEQLNILIGSVYAGNLREREKEDKMTTTKFSLYQFPDRTELKWKNANFECVELDMFSQEAGLWVCTFLKKIEKKKKLFHVQLAIPKKNQQFEVSDKDFPEQIHAYSCETKHGRVGLSFKEDKNHMYKIVLLTFEEDSTKSLAINEAGRFEEKRTNEIIWSRNGIFFALVNKDVGGPYMGKMEFGYLFKTKEQKYAAEIIFETELTYMSHCQWDPSGRLFMAYSAQTKTYEIWTPTGERLWKDTLSGGDIQYLSWRPRPLNVLDDKEDNDVITRLKDYKKIYEEEDDRIVNKLQYEREERRNKLKSDFESMLKRNRKIWDESKPDRVKLRGFDEDNLSDVSIDEIIESEQVVETVTIPQNSIK